MSDQKGKLIALYGINNLGKTTQARALVGKLAEYTQKEIRYLKYPLRNIEPTGSIINGYLREGNPYELDAQAFQMTQVMNRLQFDTELQALLEKGVHVVAEDYVGTGIAWGIGAGISKEFLVLLNSMLVEPDCAVLLDGERFLEAKEEGHTHESDDALMQKVRSVHKELGEEYGWHVVDANNSIEEVHHNIWKYVEKCIV